MMTSLYYPLYYWLPSDSFFDPKPQSGELSNLGFWSRLTGEQRRKISNLQVKKEREA
jgi:hypothetical protein